ncbi:MAG: aminotransferase class V-fold PLP-dependent enzyme [Proteobacteria bacterium]|nr:aminotransferase class V-fold PLP-dependent enzyme [Pseudomonadota bacterium]
MPSPVINAITSHIKLESEIGGYEAQDAQSDAIAAAYRSVANLLGTTADNIAFTENATASFVQALSAISFESGDVILTTRNDYASNQIQFLSLQARLGVQVIRAPDQYQGGVDVAALIALIDKHRPRLVCVTHVPTNSGLVQDINAVGNACAAAGIIYLVDACQSIGQLPIRVDDIQCDFLTATARKFLRGPRGSGFLYVSDRMLEQQLAPLFVDMSGASWTGEDSYQIVDTAKRFENWEFAWAQVLGTGAAADYAISVGVDNIRVRVEGLVRQLREGLSSVDKVRVLGNDEELCGIVTVTVDGYDPYAMVSALRAQGINVSAQGREYAVIDYDKKNVVSALRISPNYYNTGSEIDQVVAAIDSVSSVNL